MLPGGGSEKRGQGKKAGGGEGLKGGKGGKGGEGGEGRKGEKDAPGAKWHISRTLLGLCMCFNVFPNHFLPVFYMFLNAS